MRHPSRLVESFHQALPGAAVCATVPSGAVPQEATALAREALLVSPHLLGWLARAADASRPAVPGADGVPRRAALTEAFAVRFAAEHLLRFDASGAYSTRAGTDATSAPHVDAVWRPGDADPAALQVASALRDHSLVDGVEPSPVGVTAWAQPWSPTWLEFEVSVRSTGVGTTIGTEPPPGGGWARPTSSRSTGTTRPRRRRCARSSRGCR
ncbi:hypothetical protein GCM10025868_42320 [Angustibacter aerolatus]|uniref:Uncharacterized protein n=1 Tax=Angustibacter aerolatus TaxID=1162965 RepID=A0ABQ6JQ61_9ACTN|nr:hypothetical protein GCM10025868_42320 [Angustibacter aerolatus]